MIIYWLTLSTMVSHGFERRGLRDLDKHISVPNTKKIERYHRHLPWRTPKDAVAWRKYAATPGLKISDSNIVTSTTTTSGILIRDVRLRCGVNTWIYMKMISPPAVNWLRLLRDIGLSDFFSFFQDCSILKWFGYSSPRFFIKLTITKLFYYACFSASNIFTTFRTIGILSRTN